MFDTNMYFIKFMMTNVSLTVHDVALTFLHFKEININCTMQVLRKIILRNMLLDTLLLPQVLFKKNNKFL